MNSRRGKYILAIAFFFLNFLIFLSIALAQNFPDFYGKDVKKIADYTGGLDQAMLAFEQAMRSGNSQGILAAFSRTTSWRFVSYEIGTGRRLAQHTVTFAQMEQDFKARKGWWHFFVGEPIRDPNYVENFLPHAKWRRQGTTFIQEPIEAGEPIINYIKWRPEGDRWIIAEIGLPAC
jgi:hypothetical protein